MADNIQLRSAIRCPSKNRLASVCGEQRATEPRCRLFSGSKGEGWASRNRVYAVREKLGKSEDLPPGAALNLKKIQEAGEEIYYLPVSNKEMKNVIESIKDDLPEVD